MLTVYTPKMTGYYVSCIPTNMSTVGSFDVHEL